MFYLAGDRCAYCTSLYEVTPWNPGAQVRFPREFCIARRRTAYLLSHLARGCRIGRVLLSAEALSSRTSPFCCGSHKLVRTVCDHFQRLLRRDGRDSVIPDCAIFRHKRACASPYAFIRMRKHSQPTRDSLNRLVLKQNTKRFTDAHCNFCVFIVIRTKIIVIIIKIIINNYNMIYKTC